MWPRNARLEARLVEDPDDPLGYEVYADWLCREGSPHGELMQIQRWRQVDPRDPRWRQREIELLEAHAVELVGPLLAPRIRQLAWDAGYIRGIAASADELAELLAAPAGLLVHDLDILAQGAQDVIDRLAHAPPVARSLQFRTDGPPGLHVTLAPLCAGQPNLVRLRVGGRPLDVQGMRWPRLRALALIGVRLNRAGVDALLEAELPALEQLSLDDRGGQGAPATLADVERLLARLPPHLQGLELDGVAVGDGLCAAICALPCAPELRVLSLTRCAITDAGAQYLVDHGSRLANVEALRLQDNAITDRGLFRRPRIRRSI